MKEMEGKQKLTLFLSALFALGMSIYSFSTTVKSYNLLSANTDDFTGVVKNWKALPLIDFKYISSGESCPAGFEEGKVMPSAENDYELDRFADTLQTRTVWPGAHGWCECGSGRSYTYKYSTINGCTGGTKRIKITTGTGADKKESYKEINCGSNSQCSSEQKSAGCTNTWSNTLSQITRSCSTDKHRRTCSTNCTLGARLTSSSPRTGGGCKNAPATDQKPLSVFNGKKLCYKRGGKSALDRPQLDPLEGCLGGVSCGSGGHDNGEVCAISKAECPIVRLNPNTAVAPFNKGDNASKLMPVIEVRMTRGKVCAKGTEGFEDRTGEPPQLLHNFDEGCETYDSRYITFDEVSENNILTENGVTASNPVTLSNPTAMSSAQSWITSDAPTYKYYLSYRHEFSWNANCTAGSIADLSKNLTPILSMTSLQNILMILNGIFGLGILGIVFPITIIMRVFEKDQDLDCIPGKGEQELRNINLFKTICGLFAKIAKFLPVGLCLKYTGSVKDFFLKVGDARCSDAYNNDVFAKLGSQINQVHKSNQQTLVIDLVMLAVTILGWLWQWHKGCSKFKDFDGDGEEEGTELTQA